MTIQAYHTVVTGSSGGGETTLLREIQAEFSSLSIWVNFINADGITGRDLDDAAMVRSIGGAHVSDATRLSWVADSPLETARQAQTITHEYHKAAGFPTQVIPDKARNILPDGEVELDNPMRWMSHKDRDEGLKVTTAAQDPSDLNYTPIKQYKFRVRVGEWVVFHDGFLRCFLIPRNDLPTEPYQYVVPDKRVDVLHRTETQEIYARTRASDSTGRGCISSRSRTAKPVSLMRSGHSRSGYRRTSSRGEPTTCHQSRRYRTPWQPTRRRHSSSRGMGRVSNDLLLPPSESSDPLSRLFGVIGELVSPAAAVYVTARAARRGWRDGR